MAIPFRLFNGDVDISGLMDDRQFRQKYSNTRLQSLVQLLKWIS